MTTETLTRCSRCNVWTDKLYATLCWFCWQRSKGDSDD